MKRSDYESFLGEKATVLDDKIQKIKDLGPDKYLYGRMGPWPQPSPAHPFGESPAVLHIPKSEWLDWWLHVGLRYILSLGTVPYEFLWGLMRPGLKEVSDEKFHYYLTDTMMTKFISPELDRKDRHIFQDFIKDDCEYFITDLEPVKVVETFKGIYASATKTLFEKCGSEYKVICIYVDDTNEIFTPQDEEAWDLAKYFVLQGAGLCATLVVHPNLHFPIDAINAISKTSLPKDHILFKLIYPHTRFTLPLECAVLTFKTSLLQSKWWMPYAPYPGEYSGLRDLLVCGYKGIKGNDSYMPWKYTKQPVKVFGKYGEFQDAYFSTIRNFVSRVLSEIDKTDRVIKNWANYIAHWVPGFPDGEQIMEGENLIDAVAFYIWDVTVGHSIDHYDYGRMSVREVPLRIRQAPPKGKETRFSRSKLANAFDHMKYKMAQKLFFAPTNVTRLMDVDYDFKTNKHRELNEYFKEDLRKTAADLKAKGYRDYIPLEEIACSIQY